MAMLCLALVSVENGCISIHSQRPVEINVTDGESGKPLTNLPVTADYTGMMVLNIPRGVKGTTDENGRVVMRLTDFERGPIHLVAGNTGSSIDPRTVREGGTVENAPWKENDHDHKNIIMKLVPQKRTMAFMMFGIVD